MNETILEFTTEVLGEVAVHDIRVEFKVTGGTPRNPLARFGDLSWVPGDDGYEVEITNVTMASEVKGKTEQVCIFWQLKQNQFDAILEKIATVLEEGEE